MNQQAEQKKMKTSELLLRAKGLIETEGWTGVHHYVPGKGYCINGALFKAYDPNIRPVWETGEGDIYGPHENWIPVPYEDYSNEVTFGLDGFEAVSRISQELYGDPERYRELWLWNDKQLWEDQQVREDGRASPEVVLGILSAAAAQAAADGD